MTLQEVIEKITYNTPLKGIQLSNKASKLYPAFRPGDKLQFIRKNTKSIVIKVKKINFTNKHRQILHPSHIYDGTLFRVDMESLYYNLMRNTTYWNIFQTYLKRKESIEKLGI